MDAPEHPAAEPGTPAAERSSPPAERLPAGVPCYQCAYELAGLAPEGVCPECGLAIAASWPEWDLRACHRLCVEHVGRELAALQRVGLGLLIATVGGIPAAAAVLVDAHGVDATVLLMVGLPGVVVGLILVPMFLMLAGRTMRRRPDAAGLREGDGWAAERLTRSRVRTGGWLLAIGLATALPLSALAGLVGYGLAMLVGVAGVLMVSAGMASLAAGVGGLCARMRERAGHAARYRTAIVAIALPWAALLPAMLVIQGWPPHAGWVVLGMAIALCASAAGLIALTAQALRAVEPLLTEPA
jgi:hypothetical protein